MATPRNQTELLSNPAPRRVLMVKKRLASGEPCRKCVQAEELLRRKGLWDRITDVVWADENQIDSQGMQLAARHNIEVAPFFIVDADAPQEFVLTSALDVVKLLSNSAQSAPDPAGTSEGFPPALQEASTEPTEILQWAHKRFGQGLRFAFSGAEDVVIFELAKDAGVKLSVIVIDTGRMPNATYQYLDSVQNSYQADWQVLSPEPVAVGQLVSRKGFFSFYQDGHKECCEIRKVAPLAQALAGSQAWITGQRRDQSVTRQSLLPLEIDAVFSKPDAPLCKINPLAFWSSAQTWQFIHERRIPVHPWFSQGYTSIGCEPCTRPTLPGQNERAGRWWWENPEQKECGLHVGPSRK